MGWKGDVNNANGRETLRLILRVLRAIFTTNVVIVLAGTAFRDVKGTFFPAVSLHSKGEHISVNFGQQPMRFPVHELVRVISTCAVDFPLWQSFLQSFIPIRHITLVKALLRAPSIAGLFPAMNFFLFDFSHMNGIYSRAVG